MASSHGSSQSNAMLITTVLVVALVSFAGGYIVGQYSGDKLAKSDAALQAVGAGKAPSFGAAADGSNAAIPRAGSLTDSAKIPVADSYVLGNPDAPITIVEFSDFQCPFCQRGGNTVKDLQRKYPNDVRIVFKHYPLPFHQEAPAASRAAMAAGEQGKFWEFHNLVFDNQKALSRADLEKYAQQLKLNMPKFKEALDSGKYKKVVDDDLALGQEVTVQGTPTMFLNGERVSNPTDFGVISAMIDKKLAEPAKAE